MPRLLRKTRWTCGLAALLLTGCSQLPAEPSLSSLIAQDRSTPQQAVSTQTPGLSRRHPPAAKAARQASPGPSAWNVRPVAHEARQPVPSAPPTARALEQRYAQARQWERHAQNQQAVAAYKQLVAQFPEDPRAYHRLAVLYDKAGRGDLAEQPYRTALRLSPDNPELLTDFGYSRYLQGDLPTAARQLRRAVQLDSKLARAHANLALVLAQQGQANQALQAFQNAGMGSAQARATLESVNR